MRLTALPILAAPGLVLAALMSVTMGSNSAEKLSRSPPKFTLNIPPPFNASVTARHYRKGEDILNSPPFHLITVAPMTEYHGWYGPRTVDQAHLHGWTVRVYAALNPKVMAAYANARDGFEANLNEGREFLGLGQMATFETFARFARKHFRWGDAVSFLHTEYQDGPDSGLYVPDNGHLCYEVWGVTRDQQYTVVGSVFVSHPRLVSWGPDVRVVESLEALKRDRDYKLLGTCRPDKFNPSLTAFDRLLDTLKKQ